MAEIKSWVSHTDTHIKGFMYDKRWLSNFYIAEVYFEGLRYVSSENAYQAAKILPEHRCEIANITPANSKKEWQKYPLIDANSQAWDARKYDVMAVILFDKFYRHEDLRQRLIDTSDRYLEETNTWNDLYWGCSPTGEGLNNLGKILMNLRTFWKNK